MGSITAVMISFFASAVLGPVLIPFLRWLKCGQMVRSDGPAAHLKKMGTPTMGGIPLMNRLLIRKCMIKSVMQSASFTGFCCGKKRAQVFDL